jgi:hypothetical protein
MALETLFEKLNYTNARRESRLSAANWVLSRPEVFPELLEFCFHFKEDISYQACWTLEFVCLEKLELLFPYLDYYFEHLPEV